MVLLRVLRLVKPAKRKINKVYHHEMKRSVKLSVRWLAELMEKRKRESDGRSLHKGFIIPLLFESF